MLAFMRWLSPRAEPGAIVECRDVEVVVMAVVNHPEDAVTNLKSIVRNTAKRVVPESILKMRRRWLLTRSVRQVDHDLAGKPASEIFSEIYRRRLWGQPAADRKFSSGHGSYMDLHVEPYVAAIGQFARGLSRKPSVVDLGCGDFNVGSRIREYFSTYIACDVAPEVLEENRTRFADLDVEFRQLDMISDAYPDADVCIIRQVLQHLSNADISSVIRKVQSFQFLILTEPVPGGEFTPNLDQPTGVSSRLARGIPSGVVLTEPPFSLQVVSSQELCSTFDDFSNACLVTTAFRLK